LTSGHFVWSDATFAVGFDAAEKGLEMVRVGGVFAPFWRFRTALEQTFV
jgi:hypothetical protein